MKPTRAAGLYGEVVSPWSHSTEDANRAVAREVEPARALKDGVAMRQRRFEIRSPRGRN
ncbi:MAG TPA: hypothetical protein VEA15_03280 [Caulobacteraceae bacterium]|nr:hypothetical protein [Caulobacteraceae bacterium]